MPKGRYQAYVDGKSMSNVVDFTVGEANPILKANVQGNQVYFDWSADTKATCYNLKIYNGHAWQVDFYQRILHISDTHTAVALPEGTYQAYVDAVGENNYLQMGSIVEFTVGKSNPVLSANISENHVFFSWTPEVNAISNSLKIWKGNAWWSDKYSVIDTENNEATLMLPKGKYQAYVDANLENGIKMGNVIDIEITADNYHIILGDADGDGEISAIDVAQIMRYVAHIDTGVDEEVLMNADVDGNGELEIVDATYIQRYLTRMETPYAIGEAI